MNDSTSSSSTQRESSTPPPNLKKENLPPDHDVSVDEQLTFSECFLKPLSGNDPELIELDLYHQLRTYNSVYLLSKALIQNKTLIELNIWNNNLTSSHAELISNALYKNTTLKIVNFDNNKIGDKGAKVLSRMLCVNTSLLTLDVYRNNLTSIGGKEFLEMFDYNTSLKELCVWGNEIPEEIINDIETRAGWNYVGNVSLENVRNSFTKECQDRVILWILCLRNNIKSKDNWNNICWNIVTMMKVQDVVKSSIPKAKSTWI